VGIALVHGAFAAVSAAGHARFGGWHPAGADRGVPGHQAERERESRETLDEPHYPPRMLDQRGGVKRAPVKSAGIPTPQASAHSTLAAKLRRVLRPAPPQEPAHSQCVRRFLAAALLIVFTSLNAIDGIACRLKQSAAGDAHPLTDVQDPLAHSEQPQTFCRFAFESCASFVEQ
jgi:hypothetical protein